MLVELTLLVCQVMAFDDPDAIGSFGRVSFASIDDNIFAPGGTFSLGQWHSPADVTANKITMWIGQLRLWKDEQSRDTLKANMKQRVSTSDPQLSSLWTLAQGNSKTESSKVSKAIKTATLHWLLRLLAMVGDFITSV